MDFHQFHDTWYDQLHHLIKLPTPPLTDDHHRHLIINNLILHFSDYYRVMSLAANQDVLSIISSRWSTTLERSLHWVAGWRPTTAFHLIYTQSNILLESRILDIVRGLRTGDLADLSPAQLSRVSELQYETIEEENAITDQLSEWQDDACEMMSGPNCVDVDKIGGLVEIVEKANELRLRTLKAVVEVLTPQQAVELLIAAAHLQFGIRRWGLKHDRELAEKF